MSRTGKRQNGSSRARRAIALLIVIAACLVAVLIILPPSAGRSPVIPAVRGPAPGPEEPAVQRSSQPEQGEQPPVPEATAAVGRKRQERPLPRARIAVVIDDVGYNLQELQAFLDFPGPLTLSVLPNLPYSEESARRILDAGKELLLHQPMEAENGNDPGPAAILTSQEDEQIRRTLEANFAQVPGAAGMNNHMGSLATADPRVMNVIMDYLKSTGRYFLDSRTTTKTLGPETAGAYEVPYLERDIFLDNEPQAQAIRKAMEEGVEVAGRQGSAVLIGHVRNPQIVAVISELLNELDQAGVELVFLSDLLREAGS